MRLKMTASGRRELFESLRPVYQAATWIEKGRLLDGFVTGTGYNRKHAIALLNSVPKVPQIRTRRPKYGDAVVQALVTLWKAANRICSQRLIPFLPTLLESLERFGHLEVDEEVKILLLSLSPATMDRLLKNERKKYGKRKSTTRPGHLLKKQIPIRTYSDWNETRPGFFEIDLVAHGGESASGQFLNTLTITDIATTWTECFGLNCKSEAAVLSALEEAQKQLPFPILGLDSDNGSEFINHGLLNWCKQHKVTFTRSREYKKNDQAHVEERNGSVVRRLIGYDRYEGEISWRRLQNIYRQARLYINFFQPSLKLASKEREGGKLRRRYEKALSPYERLLRSNASEQSKQLLAVQFKNLDPVILLAEVENLQEQFWVTASKHTPQSIPESATHEVVLPPVALPLATVQQITRKRPSRRPLNEKPPICIYPGEKKGRKSNLDEVWDDVCLLLEANPILTPREIQAHLSKVFPGRFRPTQFNTIREKVLRWRHEHGFTFDYQKAKPGRKSNIDHIWTEALQVLELEPNLSQRRLHAMMMERLPNQVKKSQLSVLAGRLKTWKANRYVQSNSDHPELMMTLFESTETLQVVPEPSIK